MNTDFKQLCTPAKIYFVIAVIACVIALFNGMRLTAVAVKLIFAFIWSFVWSCFESFALAAASCRDDPIDVCNRAIHIRLRDAFEREQ